MESCFIPSTERRYWAFYGNNSICALVAAQDWMFGEPEQVDSFMQVHHPYKCGQKQAMPKLARINSPQYRSDLENTHIHI